MCLIDKIQNGGIKRRSDSHFKKIMSEISGNAKTRGMTPDVLENILGEKIKGTGTLEA